MTITQGAEKLQMNNEQTDWNYWQDQMNGDSQFVQYVVGLYKKQQLEKHQHDSSNRKENYPSRQQVTHHLPHLMNQPNPASPVQEINQNLMYTTKTSIDYPKLKTLNQVSSTPRRTFDESCSPDKQTRQPQKKTRADNTTTTTATPSTRQFGIPVPHLNHAIANKLPCFYIKLGIESAQMQSPSIIHLVKWIRQTIQQQTSETIEDFSLFIPAGNNRYKFGVASKHDFLKLWNCKWPSKIDQLEVEIERPRALPDCCALVIRYAPNDLDQEFIFKEITKTIRSASSMSKINYHRPRATNDYRFCVTDINEYEEILKIGTIGIGHLLLPITTFISSLNMTYCNNCWELGHRRNQCKVGPRCRKCLEAWQHDHQCQKSLCCAQCKGEHFSLSMDCVVVKNYRRTLKEEVDVALKEGVIRQVDHTNKQEPFQQATADFPRLKQNNITQQAWNKQQAPSNSTQNKQYELKQMDELMAQVKGVLDINRRMEIKMDNQILKMETLDKTSSIMRQGILVLTNVMEQMIDAVVGTKNKPLLQTLSTQLEEFKNDITEKFNVLASDYQSSITSLTQRSTDATRLQLTTTSTEDKNMQVEQKQSMNISNNE
ncbi:unnamed protein product [Adineta steineri]|uniref:Uncharacterized protein n=1 Tax=Adineta steineri TaxID=433720 RepID=A0A819UYR5_9BILA|nr:unnamed protein product [Adineta steineri]CAF4174660.1 unnamed protein product [Adineta steineri]